MFTISNASVEYASPFIYIATLDNINCELLCFFQWMFEVGRRKLEWHKRETDGIIIVIINLCIQIYLVHVQEELENLEVEGEHQEDIQELKVL